MYQWLFFFRCPFSRKSPNLSFTYAAKKGGDIRYVVFIAGVIDKTSIIYRWSVTQAMKRLQQNQLAYTSQWTLRKNSLYESKQLPNNISTKYEKTGILNIFPLMTPAINLYFRISPWMLVNFEMAPIWHTQGTEKPEVEKLMSDSL
jgi:hypothetical protein